MSRLYKSFLMVVGAPLVGAFAFGIAGVFWVGQIAEFKDKHQIYFWIELLFGQTLS